jgi:arylsulfatase A
MNSSAMLSSRLLHHFTVALTLGLACTVIAALPPAPVAAHTNIIIVLIDDLGYGDLACYGNPFVRTPNIDQLAKEGVRFTSAYSPAPVCSPSRAGIMTGRWPVRTGVTDAIGDAGTKWNTGRRLTPPGNSGQLALAEITVAELFHAAGFTTASIGKWHLGGPGFLPEAQGFEVNFSGSAEGSQKSMFGPDYGIGLPPAPSGEHLAERVEAEAEAFMRRNRDRPFFVYLSHYSVHRPVAARPATVSHYPSKGLAPWGLVPEYAAMIEEMDATIGRLMTFLREENLDQNTVVLFTSDNGAVKRWGSNGPLRGTKGTIFEGGIRVPMILRLPGGIGAGRELDVPVSGCDLLPTLLDLAGIEAPRDLQLDGQSLAPLVHGNAAFPMKRELLWHFPHYNMHGSTPSSALRFGRFKLIRFYETGRDELYDLQLDPGESRDLSAINPEITQLLGMRLTGLLLAGGARMPQANRTYKDVEPDLPELHPFESTRTVPQN